jgi:CDP-diacylglycerol---serine O-phosphatidyltransferase
MNVRKSIPNIITSINLLCGSIAVILVFEGFLHMAAIMVLVASVFDFLDGFAARLLNAYSAVGKELDSLADMVSFGLAPALVVYRMMKESLSGSSVDEHSFIILPLLAMVIAVFSALRLAIFNVDERQSNEFIGLPTPANAIFFISLPLVIHYGSPHHFLHPFFLSVTGNFTVLLILAVVFSFLLVSPYPLFSLKFTNLSFSSNSTRYIFVIIALVLVLLAGIYALPFIIIAYILLSLSVALIRKYTH